MHPTHFVPKATRRAVLAFSMALVGAACFAGPSRAADSEGEVVFAGYGGTIEQTMRDEIIPAFEEKTGIKVQYVVGTALGNYSKVLAAKNSPEIDVYWSNELTHVAGRALGLYTALDKDVVTNIEDVFSAAQDPDGIGVSSYVLALGIEYNTKAYADAGLPAPTSWYDLWDPRLKGKVALYNFNVAMTQDFVVVVTKLAGGDEQDIQPGLDKIKELQEIGNLTSFASTPAELDNMIIQGQAWATVNVSPRAFVQQNKGAPVDFVFPEEGAGFFTNYFDIVEGAPHPKAAQILVNYLISNEAQTKIAQNLVAAPINKKTKISEELARQVAYGEEEVDKMLRIDRAAMNEHLEQWADMWNRQIESQ